MRHWFFKLEVFASVLGLAAGASTALFDIYTLSNDQVPVKALPKVLSLDLIYPLFFQIALYLYLINVRHFHSRSIFLGTSFFILAQSLAFGLVFWMLPSGPYMARFLQAFPGVGLSAVLLDSSIARLAWPFMLMLLALAVARLMRPAKKQG